MFITDRMLDRLLELHSFVRPRNRNVFKNIVLSESEWLEGVYINDPDDFLLITNIGVNWVHGEVMHVIPFKSISSVRITDDEQRTLVLHQHDGIELVIPVLNETEEHPDVYAINDFLNSVIYFPHRSWNPETINEIETQDDLSDFLDEQSEGWWMYWNLVSGLKEGFPYPWQLEQFNIDPKLLDRPDLWRLLALLLSTDEDKIDNTVPRIRSRYAELFFEVGDPEPTFERIDDEYNWKPENIPSNIATLLEVETARVLSVAAEEAARFGLDAVHVEFILFAMVANCSELSCQILKCPGITKNAVKKELRNFYGTPSGKNDESMELGFNPQAIRLLEIAEQMAIEEKTLILPKHILFAISLSDVYPISMFLEKLRKKNG